MLRLSSTILQYFLFFRVEGVSGVLGVSGLMKLRFDISLFANIGIFIILFPQEGGDTDEVQTFHLDADYDYDNITLTPKFSFLPKHLDSLS